MNNSSIRKRILALCSDSKLDLLNSEDEAAIRQASPFLPEDYFASLRELGYGDIGGDLYRVYSGPIPPADVFDPATAKGLVGVLLVGEDFAGKHEAYQVSKTGGAFGWVDSSQPRFLPHKEGTFAGLLASRYAALDRISGELDAVAIECLDLLIVYYTYRETANRFNVNSGTRFDLHRWWVSLRTLENDIILRLCRLDDDDKNNHSLREAMRSVRSGLPDALSSSIDRRIKEYRQLINPLKTKARNYFLAHMSKAAAVPYDPQGGLERPIEAAVNIVDAIAGITQEYFLSVGAQEEKLDLKQELAGNLN